MTPSMRFSVIWLSPVYLEGKTVPAAVMGIEPIGEEMLGSTCISTVCWGKGWLSVGHGLSAVLKN